MVNRNRNRKLKISRAPTKAKSREPAYSQALNQIKIDRQGVKIRGVRQVDSRRLRWMILRVEAVREVGGRGGIRIGFVKKQ